MSSTENNTQVLFSISLFLALRARFQFSWLSYDVTADR